MVKIAPSSVKVNDAEFAIAQRFANSVYWQEDFDSLFSEELVLDQPFAPPGMWQHLTTAEAKKQFEWLRKTVSDWHWDAPAKVFATDHEHIYWVFRDGGGKTQWAGKSGQFWSRMPAQLRIEGGKIVYLKEHFDMAAFYKAIGVELPHFKYDAPDPATIEPRASAPVIDHTEESMARQVQATLNFFINPSYWDPEVNCVLADDFVHELVDAPADMPRVYRGTEYDSINAWLGAHMGECELFDLAFYKTQDEHVYIAEFTCSCPVTWGGCDEGGHYSNREISYIELNDQGLCSRLDEYFSTMSKFNSIGASVPSFPYLF
jgi:hypothetical protein